MINFYVNNRVDAFVMLRTGSYKGVESQKVQEKIKLVCIHGRYRDKPEAFWPWNTLHRLNNVCFCYILLC